MKHSLLWLCLTFVLYAANTPEYRVDESSMKALQVRDPRSHIKVFLPSMPYNYVSRLVNEGLVRLAENEQGWEYSLATSSVKLSPILYEFELRRNVRFRYHHHE